MALEKLHAEKLSIEEYEFQREDASKPHIFESMSAFVDLSMHKMKESIAQVIAENHTELETG